LKTGFTNATPVIVALLLSACGSTPKPAAGPVVVGWRPIQSWSGHGDMQTESFNIESGQWRIKWATANEAPPGSGTFRVTVHSAVSGRPLAVAVEHRGVGRDIAYVNEDPRLYHLVIESQSVDWSISVEESEIDYGRNSRWHASLWAKRIPPAVELVLTAIDIFLFPLN
jgi:hypothetical protein